MECNPKDNKGISSNKEIKLNLHAFFKLFQYNSFGDSGVIKTTNVIKQESGIAIVAIIVIAYDTNNPAQYISGEIARQNPGIPINAPVAAIRINSFDNVKRAPVTFLLDMLIV